MKGSAFAAARLLAAVLLQTLVLLLVFADAGPLSAAQVSGPRVLLPDRANGLHRQDPDTDVPTAVTPDGQVHKYQVTVGSVIVRGRRVTLFSLEHQAGESRTVVAQWAQEQRFPTIFEPLAAQVSPRGDVLLLANCTRGRNLNRHTDIVLLRNDKVTRTLVAGDSWSQGRLVVLASGRVAALGRDLTTIELARNKRAVEVMSDTLHDWSVAAADDGWLYVFAYDNITRGFKWAASGDSKTWKRGVVDGPEAGWQHSVAASGADVAVLYYFFRNAFNKGVKLARMKGGRLPANGIFHSEREHNCGWSPLLGVSSGGQVRVSYIADTETEERFSGGFESLEQLFAATRPETFTTWEDNYQDLFLLAGLDLGYRKWHVWAPDPGGNAAGVSPKYAFDPTSTVTISMEGKWGSTNLGVSYLQDFLGDRVAGAAGAKAGRGFKLLTGMVGWERLFLGQDVKVTSSWGSYEGTYLDDTLGRPVAKDGNQTCVEFALLNQWRMRYGLTWRRYDLTQPIYGYYAAPGDLAYSLTGSSVVDSSVNRVELFFGYSKLDYLAKYETRYSGLAFDGFLSGGVSVASWDSVNLGGHDTSGTVSLALGATARLAYLYYKRFYGLHGAGFYARLGYEAIFLASGISADGPGDRAEEDADSSDFIVTAAHHQLFHGAFLGAGVVY